MDIIGHTERVDFPQQAIAQVPAKVDTGADSSSVWATNIFQKAGTLTFTLFGPSSPYFTGQQISTNNYRQTTIRNSFGVEEVRYKVSLPVTIHNKTITAEFTLADRSKNRYAVLLGKTTLHNNFLVDVAQSNLHDTTSAKRILLLSNKVSKSAKLMAESLQKRFGDRVRVSLRQYHDLQISIKDQKLEVIDLVSNEPLSNYGFVYFRTYFPFVSLANIVTQYLAAHHIPFLDTEPRLYYAPTKLNEYAKLVPTVPVPDTIFMEPKRLKDSYTFITKSLGKPFVLKDMWAQRGDNNFLVANRHEFDAVWRKYDPEKYPRFIAQQYIPNQADLRLLVFHTKVAFALERRGTDQTYLHNTSKGGEATIVDVATLDDMLKTQAIKAAELLQRQIAGVDFIQDRKTNKWYILEVNSGPQISSGSFVEEKMTAFGVFLEDYLQQLENKGQL